MTEDVFVAFGQIATDDNWRGGGEISSSGEAAGITVITKYFGLGHFVTAVFTDKEESLVARHRTLECSEAFTKALVKLVHNRAGLTPRRRLVGREQWYKEVGTEMLATIPVVEPLSV